MNSLSAFRMLSSDVLGLQRTVARRSKRLTTVVSPVFGGVPIGPIVCGRTGSFLLLPASADDLADLLSGRSRRAFNGRSRIVDSAFDRVDHALGEVRGAFRRRLDVVSNRHGIAPLLSPPGSAEHVQGPEGPLRLRFLKSPKITVPTNRMIPMIASQSRPLMAKPTTARTAHTMSKMTRTVHMLFTLRASAPDGYGFWIQPRKRIKMMTHRVVITEPVPALTSAEGADDV